MTGSQSHEMWLMGQTDGWKAESNTSFEIWIDMYHWEKILIMRVKVGGKQRPHWANIPSERRLQSPTRSEHDQSGYTGNYRAWFSTSAPANDSLSSVYFEERANFMTDEDGRGRSLASQVTGQMTLRLRKTKWKFTMLNPLTLLKDMLYM